MAPSRIDNETAAPFRRPKSTIKSSKKRKLDEDTGFAIRKKKKANPFTSGTARPKKHSIAPLKTRIRDLKRKLSHVERLPADIRVGHERELAALERELEMEKAEIERQDMISKYHMVRFFDRRKGDRRLKKAKKALEGAADSERIAAEKELHDAEVGLNYSIYYPLRMVYVSLYPSKGKKKGEAEEDDEQLGLAKKGNEEIWKKIEEAMEQGPKALAALRESTSTEPKRVVPEKAKKSTKTSNQSKQTVGGSKKKGFEEESEDESDGGFFE